jgi:hypothetical protein
MQGDRKNRGSQQMTKNGTANITDDDIESEADFAQEETDMIFSHFPMFGQLMADTGKFNMTHFLDQQKKRAHAIVESIDYKKYNNWKHQLMDNL